MITSCDQVYTLAICGRCQGERGPNITTVKARYAKEVESNLHCHRVALSELDCIHRGCQLTLSAHVRFINAATR